MVVVGGRQVVRDDVEVVWCCVVGSAVWLLLWCCGCGVEASTVGAIWHTRPLSVREGEAMGRLYAHARPTGSLAPTSNKKAMSAARVADGRGGRRGAGAGSGGGGGASGGLVAAGMLVVVVQCKWLRWCLWCEVVPEWDTTTDIYRPDFNLKARLLMFFSVTYIHIFLPTTFLSIGSSIFLPVYPLQFSYDGYEAN